MKTTTTWIQQADDALKRAAKRAREVAERTGTCVLVQKDGRIVKVFPVGGERVLREEPPPYGEKQP